MKKLSRCAADTTGYGPSFIFPNKFPFKLNMTVFYHVTYAFQSESTLYSCLNVKELPARNSCDIWSLSGYNEVSPVVSSVVGSSPVAVT